MHPLWAASLGKLGLVGVQPMQLLQLSGYLLPWPAEVSGIKGAHRVSGVIVHVPGQRFHETVRAYRCVLSIRHSVRSWPEGHCNHP